MTSVASSPWGPCPQAAGSSVKPIIKSHSWFHVSGSTRKWRHLWVTPDQKYYDSIVLIQGHKNHEKMAACLTAVFTPVTSFHCFDIFILLIQSCTDCIFSIGFWLSLSTAAVAKLNSILSAYVILFERKKKLNFCSIIIFITWLQVWLNKYLHCEPLVQHFI